MSIRDVHWSEAARIVFVAVAAAVSWLRIWQPYGRFDLVGLAAALIGGYPIFREAAIDLWSKRMTMELSMTIALVAALAIGEVFTALVIVFFVLVAEVLEHLTVARGRAAIRDLLAYLPATAEVRRDGEIVAVAIEEVRRQDIVVVKPGANIPVDGSVVGGHSFVDQGAITGESVPVEKMSGHSVFAGTINQSGILEIATEAVGRDTAFGRIIEAVERAEQMQAPIQKTADRLAGYLVYFALSCAVLVLLFTRDLRSTISVIIVAGACGIAAGTPLAILGAIGRAARAGAIVKGGRYMETLSSVDTVVLDKTGTLTLGRPEVIGVYPATGVAGSRLIQVAASAERLSEHPIGKALLSRAGSLRVKTEEPSDFDYQPGAGISCLVEGDRVLVGTRNWLDSHGIRVPGLEKPVHSSRVFVAHCGVYLGMIEVADVLRSGAHEAVASLKKLGIRTVLLTGDVEMIAKAVADELGVDEVEAGLLPEQKLERIHNLRSQGRVVAMVGDGINDSPALMAANVGIAMGSGTDIARESASVLLIGDDLTRLAVLLSIARRAKRIIMANFGGTLAVDGVGVAMAAAGLLNPIVAALIHVISELVFILNSARLLARGGTGGPTARRDRVATAKHSVASVDATI